LLLAYSTIKHANCHGGCEWCDLSLAVTGRKVMKLPGKWASLVILAAVNAELGCGESPSGKVAV
jgi:hypothetical protein